MHGHSYNYTGTVLLSFMVLPAAHSKFGYFGSPSCVNGNDHERVRGGGHETPKT